VKKLPLIVTLIVITSLVGGYFLYEKYFNRAALTAWDIVPAETILAYEGSACASCLETVRGSTVVKLVNNAAFATDDSLQVFTEIILANFRPGSLISMHITKKDDFDFVFYLPNNVKLEQDFNNAILNFQRVAHIIVDDREYNSVQINEVTLGNRTFSWIRLEGIWIGSFSAVLIEDVIRTYGDASRNFMSELGSVYQLPTIKNDGGNLYLNLRQVAQWLALFTTDQPTALVHQFGKSALLDVKMGSRNNFVLNGFCLDSASNPNYILSSFSGQQPVPFTLKNFISNRALMVTSYGISDGALFSRDLNRFSAQNRSAVDTLQKIASSLKVNVTELTNSLSGELGVCWLESKGSTLSKVLIINSENGADNWLTAFNTLSQKLSLDTIFHEQFANYEIRELPLYRLPEKMFWPLVSGFNASYYTSLGNTLFVAENLEELKRFLEDIDREDTWGKSVAQNQFLESTLLESNISLYINAPMIWSVLERSLHPRWKQFVRENRVMLRSLGMGAIQFSHLNDSYYTNISWADHSPSGGTPTTPVASDKIITNFNEPLANMFIVRSHVSKHNEVLVQDSTKNIRLVSSDGKVLWRESLSGFITGSVTEVDFFSNGKLQYFFATPGELHIIDRLGNYVSPFPVKIRERDIEFAQVVDYDHSKNYRFLISSGTGKLWMYDKSGNNLEGWKPNDVGDGLSAAAQHHRIRGRDFILAVRKDGTVYLLNRRGEKLPGFPLNLNARPSGDYYLEMGNTLESTSFIVVSRDGFRIKFSTEGKIQTRETLLKNTVDTQFSLVLENSAKSYMIVRQEPKQMTVYNDELKPVLVSEFLGNNSAGVQYLDFGAGRVYIVVTDRVQDLSFVYDGQGVLQSTLPIDGQSVAVRPMENDKLKVFSLIDRVLTISPL
jgi:hypothetical protein